MKVAKVTHLSSPPVIANTSSSPPDPSSEGTRVGVTLKVYAKCLAPDIEYKTVIVTKNMSSRELILMLLSKCRMKHRDPKLFYLTMDVTVKKTGIPIKRTMVLDEDARPAQLRSCNPWGECKFSLQMRKGGLVRVYDSVLVSPEWQGIVRAALLDRNRGGIWKECIYLIFNNSATFDKK